MKNEEFQSEYATSHGIVYFWTDTSAWMDKPITYARLNNSDTYFRCVESKTPRWIRTGSSSRYSPIGDHWSEELESVYSKHLANMIVDAPKVAYDYFNKRMVSVDDES